MNTQKWIARESIAGRLLALLLLLEVKAEENSIMIPASVREKELVQLIEQQ